VPYHAEEIRIRASEHPRASSHIREHPYFHQKYFNSLANKPLFSLLHISYQVLQPFCFQISFNVSLLQLHSSRRFCSRPPPKSSSFLSKLAFNILGDCRKEINDYPGTIVRNKFICHHQSSITYIQYTLPLTYIHIFLPPHFHASVLTINMMAVRPKQVHSLFPNFPQ
jgi:hypothetical protein